MEKDVIKKLEKLSDEIHDVKCKIEAFTLVLDCVYHYSTGFEDKVSHKCLMDVSDIIFLLRDTPSAIADKVSEIEEFCIDIYRYEK